MNLAEKDNKVEKDNKEYWILGVLGFLGFMGLSAWRTHRSPATI